MINDFIMTLSKVYQEEYLTTLEELAREILFNRSFEGYLQEIVFLEMFINSEAWQTIQGQGATEIGCQAQFVRSIYDQFIQQYWPEFIARLEDPTVKGKLLR